MKKRIICTISIFVLVAALCSGCIGNPFKITDSFASYYAENKEEAGSDLEGMAADLAVVSDSEATDPNYQSNDYADLLINDSANEIVESYHCFDKLYPASITKVMTALLTLEHGNMDDEITLKHDINLTEDGAVISTLTKGDTVTVGQVFHTMLIKSANDCAVILAEYVAGSEAKFIDMMNERARELGATHTHFVNASGLPDENHYSSAHDLAKIMRACLRNKRFRQVMKCSNYKIPATNLSEARVMHTHMPLMAKESNLYYADCIGGKTGFSTDAQHTLVTAAERNGRTYIAVTMRAADLGINCTDSTSLFNYAFDNFDTIDVDGTAMTVPKGVTVNDLTTDTAERNGKMLTRYYYSGQFVGYVAEAQPTETPAVEETAETAAESSETEAAESVTDSVETTENDSQAEVKTEQKSMSEQIQEIRTDGLSGTRKVLLIAMGVMAVILVALLIALHIKNG